jgi:pyruvate dehydrogenase E2 component (dihydrolipoamide acetyltransferase)
VVDVVMPKWGLTMEEGTVGQWLRKVGDKVSAGEPLFDAESDKASADVESPVDGILAEILVEQGATVPTGEVVARICSAEEWAARRAG